MFSQLRPDVIEDKAQRGTPTPRDLAYLFWGAVKKLSGAMIGFGVVVFGIIQLVELSSPPEDMAAGDVTFLRLVYLLAGMVALSISAAMAYAAQVEFKAYYYEITHDGYLKRAALLERQVEMHQKAEEAGFLITSKGKVVAYADLEEEDDDVSYDFDYDLAKERLVAFVKKAWAESLRVGENPSENAIGFARENFCKGKTSGSFARRLYDAALRWVRDEQVGLLVGRKPPNSGWFGVKTLDEAIALVEQKFEYVKLPAILGQIEPPNSLPKSPKSPKSLEGRHKE